MEKFKCLAVIIFCLIHFAVKSQSVTTSYSEKMATTVMTLWRDSLAHIWTYDQGVVYGGFEALWRNTANPDYFNYIKKNIDYYLNEDGTIKTHDKENYNLDNLKNGNALLLLFNVTGENKYFKAATLLRDQLRTHPRTNEGGFWHKKLIHGKCGWMVYTWPSPFMQHIQTECMMILHLMTLPINSSMPKNIQEIQKQV